MRNIWGLSLALLGMLAVGCPGNDPGVGDISDQLGVGAQCSADQDCYQGTESEPLAQSCLEFKGGYCGVADCAADTDCPEGSACVTHTDGKNYCFLTCATKSECNVNRTLENESNCSANVTFIGEGHSKACVPPAG